MAGGRYTMNDELLTKKTDAGGLPVVANSDRTCPGKMEVPTEKEREALVAMKTIKERVRALKKRLASLDASDSDEGADEILAKEEELARLKVEWDRWEEKRGAAAKERMIILGHEEGAIRKDERPGKRRLRHRTSR